MSKKTKRNSMRDAVRKQAEERQQSTGGGTKFIFPEGKEITFFKPEKGTMSIDILPYVVSVDNHPVVSKGDMWYERTIQVHNAIGAEEKAYICLKTIGKRCPICDARAAMMKDANADEEIIKALKPKDRQVFNIIDTADKDGKVQLWEVSYHLFGKLLETEVREGDDDYADFAELEGGKTLKVRFKEKTMGKHKFLEADRIDFKDRDDYDEDILDDVFDLDAILNIHPYEKLEAIFLEQEEEEVPKKAAKKSSKDDDDDEEEEKPKRSKASKKPVKEEEEDEEEDEKPVRKSKRKASDDDDEEEEKPKSKRASKKPPVEDDDDEEEEEEEKPKPKKSSKKAAVEDDDDDEEEEEVKKPAKKSKGKKEECPEGYEFGTDCDEYEECFDCPLWEDCQAANEAANPPKAKKKK